MIWLRLSGALLLSLLLTPLFYIFCNFAVYPLFESDQKREIAEKTFYVVSPLILILSFFSSLIIEFTLGGGLLLLFILYLYYLFNTNRVNFNKIILFQTLFIFVVFAFISLPSLLASAGSQLRHPVSPAGLVGYNLILSFITSGLFVLLGRKSRLTANFTYYGIPLLLFIIHFISIAHLAATGFNLGPLTFIHMNLQSVKIFFVNYYYIGIGFLLMTLFFVMGLYFTRKLTSDTPRHLGAFLLFISLVLFGLMGIKKHVEFYVISPAFAMIFYPSLYYKTSYQEFFQILKNTNYSREELYNLKKLGMNYEFDVRKNNAKFRPGIKPLNLISIYIESYQHNFTEPTIKDPQVLTPNINRLTKEFTVVPNFYNSVTPTINALITSQCGINIQLDYPNTILKTDSTVQNMFGSKPMCLTDVLHQFGYEQIFFLGSSPNFSGKKQFLQLHSMDKFIGYKQLNRGSKYTKRRHTWGVHDTDLVKEALTFLDSRESTRPFHFLLQTVNTHQPGYTAPDCEIMDEAKPMLNAVFCADYAVGIFLAGLRERGYFENSVIVLFGDHVMFATQANANDLGDRYIPSNFGKSYFAFYVPGRAFRPRIDTVGYTPDYAPTVLDLLGIDGVEFIQGKSLLHERARYQRLVAPQFEIFNRTFRRRGGCHYSNIGNAKIVNISKKLSPCQVTKVHIAAQKIMMGMMNPVPGGSAP